MMDAHSINSDQYYKLSENSHRRQQNESNVLILGGGKLAQRYYHTIAGEKNADKIKYCGYLAEKWNDSMPKYKGRIQVLETILQTEKISLLVIAFDCQELSSVQICLNLADKFHVEVEIIPVYSDFISSAAPPEYHSGIWSQKIQPMDTCEIMGVNIAVTDMDKTVAVIGENLEDWRGKYICVANVHTTVTASRDPDYRKVQNNAVMALPDGGPLSKYSRDVGYYNARRVTGPSLMQEILKQNGEKKYRHYFYGSTQETLDKLKSVLQQKYPDAVLAGMYSPPFRPLSNEEDEEIVRMINETHPDFVWVGLGAPKQERWMASHEGRINALMIGVGAAFDYEAGNIQRAPQWMQKHNLEWFYRLMQDPKRLFKRYLSTNIRYLVWCWRNK